MATIAKVGPVKPRPRAAAARIASQILSRKQGAPVARRHAAAVKSGNTPKGAR